VACDVGLVQRSPLVEDLSATVAALGRARFWQKREVAEMAAVLDRLDVQLVLADISPLGLAAAAAAGRPSVLIENFTWDWIYDGYPDAPVELRRWGRQLAPIFAGADLHLQTEPVCRRLDDTILVPPIARRSRHPRAAVRRDLGVPAEASMVVVSMGGVPWDPRGLAWRSGPGGPWIVVPGGSDRVSSPSERVLLLPFRADVYHPDLVAASDVVVSKLGYSTVAEASVAGAALAFLPRPQFPESPALARWVERQMRAVEITEHSLEDGSWLDAIAPLLEEAPGRRVRENGAAAAAHAIMARYADVLV
jgi:hypothetical protein